MIDNKLNGIHTAYLAKVLSTSGRTAKIQPLGLYKNADGTTSKQAVLTKVPISRQTNVEAGDIAICICCEQNISEAKRGNNALPPAGRFSMSDSIIIGVL